MSHPDFFSVAEIASVGYDLVIECAYSTIQNGPVYQVRSIPGGPSHLGRPVVLYDATWEEAMDYCRDRVTADIAAEIVD